MPENADIANRTRSTLTRVIVAATILCVAWLLLFAGGRTRIGVDGEWVWRSHAILSTLDVAIPVGLTGLFLAVSLAGFQRLADRADRNPRHIVWMLPLTVVFAFVSLAALQTCAPTPHRQLKPMWVLYHWGASGYFVEVREIDSLADYLAGYEAEMAKGEVLHQGTHPPGLVIVNRMLLELCRSSPRFARVVRWTVPGSVAEAFEPRVPRTTLSPADRSALWLSVLLTQLATSLTVVPLYVLLRRDLGHGSALLAAALWPLVPGLAVFLPKSDAVYPLLAVAVVALSVSAWHRGSRPRAALAGLVFWFGMLFSLAMLPVAVVVGMYGVLTYKQRDLTWSRIAGLVAAAAGAFVVATLVFAAAFETRLWNVWPLNFQNHAGFYAQFERTYSKWLLANPVELALTVGGPLLVVAASGCVSGIRRQRAATFASSLAVLGVWAMLWLSGKNMGEAARLWLFLTPLFVWSAGVTLERTEATGVRPVWCWLAGCQAVVAVVTAVVLNGFSVPL